MTEPSSAPSGRERIFEAAVAVLLEVGLKRAQTRAVTERAGVGTGLLNHYFRWPDLRAAAWAEIFDRVARDTRHDGEDPAAALERFFVEAFSDEARPVWRLWLEAEDLAPSDPAMARALAAARATLRAGLVALLETGVAAGAWALDAPAATAIRLEALRDGLAGMVLSGDPDIGPDAAGRHLRAAFALERRG